MSLPIAMVAAVGRNGAIGAGNRLPWRLPGDLRHFRALTWGKPVIMGRVTFESLGRPLPGRHLVVVSGDAAFEPPPGVELARGIPLALDAAAVQAIEHGATEIMVAGGATLYRALMERADTLYLTEVDLAPDGDAFFPPMSGRWREVGRVPQPKGPGDEAAYAFVTHRRI